MMRLVADGMRAVSEWEKQEMIKKGIPQSLIRVITNGLEDEAYVDVEKKASAEIKEKVSKWGDYIIQVGRVYPIKNNETTIRALSKTKTNLKYVLVGPVADAEYQKSLMKLAGDLGVSDRVIFAGVIRGVDKYYAIKKAKMMVHMAIWESFCNVVHEGLSQGTICIVANNTALPLLIQNNKNGYVVETHDDTALSEKIDYVFNNMKSEEIKQIQKKSKEIGDESSWEHVAINMATFYNDAIKKVRGSL
jgi:glycosyltransferase involved in cell wall biosynthesis